MYPEHLEDLAVKPSSGGLEPEPDHGRSDPAAGRGQSDG